MRFDRRYVDLLIRWLWLIVLAGIVAGGASFWVSRNEAAAYEAKARLIVGPGVDNPNPTINDLRTSGQLMQTYAELATTRKVMDEVVHTLNLDIEPDKLDNHVSAKSNTETLILTVQAVHPEPKLAVVIANGVAEALVRLPSSSMKEIAVGVQREVGEVQGQIDRAAAHVRTLEAELGRTADLEQQKLIREQIKNERDLIAENHKTLATLYESQQETYTNRIEIIEAATGASRQASTLRLNVLVAALAGMLAATLLALAAEYLDRSIKSPEQLAVAAGAPVTVGIERYAAPAASGREALVVRADPDGAAAEGFRRLVARLMLAEREAAGGVLLVCDSQAAKFDDSGEVAANLAVSLADAGRSVVLVDANLHAPRIGALFGVAERGGLADVLTGRAPRVEKVTPGWAPGLSVVATAAAGDDAFRLLAGARLREILAALRVDADRVVVAGPPLLSHAEGLLVVGEADGVLLVARHGRTPRGAMAEASAQVRAAGGRLVAAVLAQARKGESLASAPATAGEAARPAPMAVEPRPVPGARA